MVRQKENQRRWMHSPKGKACRMTYYFANRDKWRDCRFRNAYGITLEQYNEIREAQSGRCAICKRHESELKRALHVDHDHATGKVRGLLCEDCNVALGRFRDDAAALFNAFTYLSFHR